MPETSGSANEEQPKAGYNQAKSGISAAIFQYDLLSRIASLYGLNKNALLSAATRQLKYDYIFSVSVHQDMFVVTLMQICHDQGTATHNRIEYIRDSIPNTSGIFKLDLEKDLFVITLALFHWRNRLSNKRVLIVSDDIEIRKSLRNPEQDTSWDELQNLLNEHQPMKITNIAENGIPLLSRH